MKARSVLSARRKEELMGLVMITLAFLMLFSLVSHSVEDDFNLIGNTEISIFDYYPDNWVGLLGAGLSYILFYLIGFLSYFLPLFALFGGVKYLFRWKIPRLKIKSYYVFYLIAAVFMLLSIKYVDQGSSIDFISAPGGAITIGITSFFIKILGKVGTIALLFTITIVLVSMITEWRPSWWDSKIARVPKKVREKLNSFFGFSKAKKSSTKKPQTETEAKSSFSFKSIFKPFTIFAEKIKGIFLPKPESSDISSDTDNIESMAEDKVGEFKELFEKLGDNTDTHTTDTDQVSQAQKEKLVLKLTRKPEDGFQFPDIGLLEINPQTDKAVSDGEIKQVAKQLLDTLKTFNISIVDDRIEKFPGPVVTRYEFKPAPGIKVNQVVNLSDDLALALQAKRIRIIAPVPGKAAIGVEMPNRYPQTVYLSDIISDKSYSGKSVLLPMALGLTASGNPYTTDLAAMPHLLIAGATGSGKSVCMNAIITSLIYRHHPRDLRFIFIDPKMLELSIYSGIPHLERPVITRPKQAQSALNDAVIEMENRYKKLAGTGVRNIVQYNNKVKTEERLPYIVVMVDELADLMMSNQSSRIEIMFTRLAQMARAVGIHLILATQRPSVDVITGLIKANFSARIAFQVATKVDSRTILDCNGAEKLLGKGDMLFLAPGQAEPIRVHGAFISSEESTHIVDFIKQQQPQVKPIETMTEEQIEKRALVSDADPLYKEAVEVVVRHKQGSVSLLQRRLGIGYQRAARLIDLLESKGVVGTYDGSKAREVLVDQTYLEQIKANSPD